VSLLTQWDVFLWPDVREGTKFGSTVEASPRQQDFRVPDVQEIQTSISSVFDRRFCRIGALVLSVIAMPQAGMAQDFTAPSIVRAKDFATLSTLISGTIEALPFDEGETFAKGDVLFQVDCGLFRSQADAATAESLGAVARVTSQEALLARGGIGRVEVEVARADAAAALARVRSADLRVEYCEVRAPYNGVIAEHAVSEFEYVEPGQPVLSIISSGTPDLEIIAPSEWLGWVTVGTGGRVQLESTRAEVGVIVETLGPVVDPVSRTVKMTARFDADVTGILPGMSGLVTLERDE
jgi:RND family efflux transporter MFP subunit